MGISNGLALTTGLLSDLPGTGNSNDDFDFCVGTITADPQLTALSSSATRDACIIEFDVVPQCTSMGITFVFGSDEYTNWVNQTFNDAFGFFVSGPNPGGGNYSNQNIAVIPNGTNVSVDNVSHLTNTAFFVNNNSAGSANHFDGFTTVLTPSISVTPCATYHIKLAIADAGDCSMDSGVLIDIIQCNNVTTASLTSTPASACGVNDGTATVTVNNGLPPLTYTWSPAPGGGQGTTTATGLTAGTTYTITVNDNFTCIPAATASITIGGPVAPAVTVNSSTVCSGVSATLTGTPSTGGGTFLWSPGGETTSSITVSPASTTTYTVSYTLSGCTGTATGTVTVNPQPVISPVAPVCSSAAAFNLTTNVAGGVWSGTGITNTSAGTFTPSSAASGTNVITYTAAGGCNDTVHVIVIPGADPAWSAPASICILDPAVDLTTFLTGTPGGTWSGSGVTGNMFDPAGLSGNIAVTYTVGSAPCQGVSTQSIFINQNVPPVITTIVPVLCSNQAPFTLSADIPGGTWTGPGITNGSAGTFDPSAAPIGTDTVIYEIAGSCRGADTLLVTVNQSPNAAWSSASLCANNGAINLDSLVTLASGTAGGTWSGSGVTGNMFDPAGLSGGIPVTYMVGTTCKDTLEQNITVIPNADPSWTTTTVCQVSSLLNLDNLVTGTAGGTWSGNGVSGNTFNPSGLSGNIPVTYTVGTVPCQSVSTQNINVVALSDASWTATAICASDSIDLDTTVTGTPGGTWTGTGVTDSMFYGSGLTGLISVTYTVGPVGCQASTSHDITVTPVGDPSWTTTSLCAGAAPINLNTLITGTSGGTWSGTGVTGNTFNPSGLSGNIAVTYLTGTAPCQDSLTQNINVVPSSSPAWTPASLCANAAPLDLNTTVTGTPGGTWSGTGVTGNMFSPAGLSGNIQVTYTVGTAPCIVTSSQNIVVIPNADATITPVSPVCEGSSAIFLTAANPGGTWSGNGVSPSGIFNPAAVTPGTHPITYTIPGACGASNTISIIVVPNPLADWDMPSFVCENSESILLDTLVTGTLGGTFTGPGVSGNVFDPSEITGTHQIVYTVTQNGCTATSSEFVTVDSIYAGFTASPTFGEAPLLVNVQADTNSYAINYFWDFGDGSTSSGVTSSNTYSSMGDYDIVLTTTSAQGCTDTARIRIHVEEVSALAVANVFTPNGDGKNDTFYPVIAEGITEFKASIYDRWGLKISEWSDETKGWDGKVKSGKMAPDGTYYYIITGKGIDSKTYEFKGFVQIYN
jgi:gliding motility-associated-like protein